MGYISRLIEDNYNESLLNNTKNKIGKYTMCTYPNHYTFYREDILICEVKVGRVMLDIWEKRKGFEGVINGNERRQIELLHRLTGVVGVCNSSDR